MTKPLQRIGLDLDGMMHFVPKSRRPLAPIFEAISNGLEAIADRLKETESAEPGRITIRFFYDTGLLPTEAKTLKRIEISDNGIGFDDRNYGRFATFFDRSKGYNNRGSGRVQFMHFAQMIEVTSHYHINGNGFKRHFLCNPKTYITDSVNEPAERLEASGSTVAMSLFYHDNEAKKYFDALTLVDLQRALKSQYLLRMHLAKSQKPDTVPSFCIEFYHNENLAETGKLTVQDIPTPSTGDIHVSYVKVKNPKADDIEWVQQVQHKEKLHWAHFKLNESDLAENGVVLCSKDIAVQPLRFDAIKKADVLDGCRYLTAVYGGALDKADHVSHTVDRFTLPKRADVEKAAHDDLFFDPTKEYLFFDDIEQAVEDTLPLIYTDLYKRKEAQKRNIESIAKAHGIPSYIAHSTKIGISDTEEQITEKIFKKQAESLAHQNIKIKNVFESLDKLIPTNENYQVDLERKSEELLRLIPEQNKQELSRYVIRREMVARVLGMILDQKFVSPSHSKKAKAGGKKQRQEPEGLIHDLLIRRKTTSPGGPNDLWVLNEEFVHFEACSDMPIDQIKDSKGHQLLRLITDEDKKKYGIKPSRRPDIFFHVDESQCVLIELKAPDEDLADHLNQLQKYCALIGNFAIKPLTRFYCYLIGEEFSPIDILGDFRVTVHGDYVRRGDYKIMRYENGRQDEEIGAAHVEIIKLSSMYARARRRNKSFADRLGISDDIVSLTK